ncbi:MAG: hypothetical protein E3J63_01010 [Elusimicrobia bacterium]|nr:MAG: hypothetical protein E3J63_01010 [Elusimicrobiota bacterium]
MNTRKELERIITEKVSRVLLMKSGKVIFTQKETMELAQSILAKLPKMGFVRLEDVEIDLDKMLVAFDKHILASGWEGRVGNYIKFKGKSESDYIPALEEIVKAKPIRVKEGRK